MLSLLTNCDTNQTFINLILPHTSSHRLSLKNTNANKDYVDINFQFQYMEASEPK